MLRGEETTANKCFLKILVPFSIFIFLSFLFILVFPLSAVWQTCKTSAAQYLSFRRPFFLPSFLPPGIRGVSWGLELEVEQVRMRVLR